MNSRDHFYLERDRRTIEYGVTDIFDAPVAVVVGAQAAGCLCGQIAVLALVNMLARVHRNLHLEIPAVRLIRPAIVDGHTLDEAARVLARTIDPFIVLDGGDYPRIRLGLGADAPAGADWYFGADRQVAVMEANPVPFNTLNHPSLGAGLTACLAAATATRHLVGKPLRAVRLSAWDFSEGPTANLGPEDLGVIDVGRVLQVGAGGVGSCLDYWVRDFGGAENWDIVDADAATLHNTNRSMGLFPHHTTWHGMPASNKAIAAADLCGAHAIRAWYDELGASAGPYDLILPLANERNVRHDVACRGEPVILHATTSRTWEAQLHRHVPKRDDCIACRMPASRVGVKLACATVQLANAPNTRPSDAALPFLSASAGLLLVAGLFRLQHGLYNLGRHNLWALAFNNPRTAVRKAIHAPCACGRTPGARARGRIHAGGRWSRLDNTVPTRAGS